MDEIAPRPMRTLRQTTAYLAAVAGAAFVTMGVGVLLHRMVPAVPMGVLWLAMAWPLAYVLACHWRRLHAINPADSRCDQVEAIVLLLVILPLQPSWDYLVPHYGIWIFVGIYAAFALASPARDRAIDRYLAR